MQKLKSITMVDRKLFSHVLGFVIILSRSGKMITVNVYQLKSHRWLEVNNPIYRKGLLTADHFLKEKQNENNIIFMVIQ